MVHNAPLKLPANAHLPSAPPRTITAKVYVDSHGRAQKVILLDKVPNRGIEDAVREAALASTYAPGLRDGKPVAGCVRASYRLP